MQRRGGRGIIGMEMKEEDFVENLFISSTHNYILFFTNLGRIYWEKVYEIPEGSRQSRGKAIVNLLELKEGETINAMIPVKEFDENHYLLMATSRHNQKDSSIGIQEPEEIRHNCGHP